ncbi:Yip1 family protein [Dictyobacter arantiisoli]|uniref:Yip1 domain-containing protein n=1 Tax=Dictyobacter arantiisoli TaxID=2014874 RepID=A0A5A5T7P6_9CHLR|nr:Yip1 family protein [Dictyobacter arantiisoli]GCF06979.1 hypothetical protein KDI_05430 [Dictyobacter arantiisoli]
MSYDPNQSNNPESTPPPPPNENPYPGYPSQPEGQPYIGYGYPPVPQPGYGHPPQPPYPGAGFNVPPAQPLPLGEAIKRLPAQYLRVLTKPGAATFAQEKGKAAWNIIWVQIAIVAVLAALLFLLSSALLTPLLFASFQSPRTMQIFEFYRNLSLPLSIAELVLVPVGIFISVGLYYLIARAFKGQGTFLEYMYSYLLFSIPLSLLDIIIAFIPFVGSLASLAVFVYMIILQVYMTMAVHRMSGGRATMAVLLLPIIMMILACALSFVIISIAVSAAKNMQ